MRNILNKWSVPDSIEIEISLLNVYHKEIRKLLSQDCVSATQKTEAAPWPAEHWLKIPFFLMIHFVKL